MTQATFHILDTKAVCLTWSKMQVCMRRRTTGSDQYGGLFLPSDLRRQRSSGKFSSEPQTRGLEALDTVVQLLSGQRAAQGSSVSSEKSRDILSARMFSRCLGPTEARGRHFLVPGTTAQTEAALQTRPRTLAAPF